MSDRTIPLSVSLHEKKKRLSYGTAQHPSNGRQVLHYENILFLTYLYKFLSYNDHIHEAQEQEQEQALNSRYSKTFI
jgi:hypothetical protein